MTYLTTKMQKNIVKASNFVISVISKRRNLSNAAQERSVRSMYQQKEKKIDGLALFLLAIPASTFALGTWQVQRKKWKESLISELASRTALPPVDLPHDLDELSSMEFHPVRVVGTFDHSKEIYMGPRSLLLHGDGATSGRSIISQAQAGFLVVTPFMLADRDVTILVNRGWVPHKQKSPKSREEGQIQGEIELVGIVRNTEQRQPFSPQNVDGSKTWFYRDLDKMAECTGSEPILLDATASSTVPGGPIGGQTRVTLRNEHLSYILTWYGLSAATAMMWYRQFISRAKVV